MPAARSSAPARRTTVVTQARARTPASALRDYEAALNRLKQRTPRWTLRSCASPSAPTGACSALRRRYPHPQRARAQPARTSTSRSRATSFTVITGVSG